MTGRVEMKGGIPEKLYEDVYEFRYNNLDQLEDLMAKHGDQTAAIIMTPFGHPLHQKMEEPEARLPRRRKRNRDEVWRGTDL